MAGPEADRGGVRNTRVTGVIYLKTKYILKIVYLISMKIKDPRQSLGQLRGRTGPRRPTGRVRPGARKMTVSSSGDLRAPRAAAPVDFREMREGNGDPAGTRTRNLPLRRRTRYPLCHEVLTVDYLSTDDRSTTVEWLQNEDYRRCS